MLIWLLADSDPAKFLAFKNLVGAFTAHHPEIKTDFRVMTRRTMWFSLFAYLRDPKNREAPDLIELPHNWTAVFAKLGLLAEVPSVFDGFNPARYPDFLHKGCLLAHNDTIFSAPWWMEAPALFFRPDELKRRGLRPETVFEDWNSFMAACEKLAAGNNRRGYYPVMQGSGRIKNYHVLPCAWNRGGDFFSEDFNRCTLSKDEAVSGMEDYLEPALRGYMPLFSEAVFEGGPFFEDHCAMVFGSRLPVTPGKKNTFKPVRIPGVRKKDLVLSYNLAVVSGSSKLKEAGAFLKWALSPENNRAFALSFGAFPCLKQVVEEILDDSRLSSVWRAIFTSPAMPPNTTVYPTAELLLDKALWNATLRMSRQSYTREDFLRELIIAQGEIDYLLSLY